MNQQKRKQKSIPASKTIATCGTEGKADSATNEEGFWLKKIAPNDPDTPLEKVRIPVEMDAFLQQILGVAGHNFAGMLFSQTGAINRPWNPTDACLGTVVETLTALKPQGGMQAMLSVQMVGTHAAATFALKKAMAEGVLVDEAEQKINRATKLMRLFAQQVELMARLQGTLAQQRIVIEKVDVNAGGQAIVGAIGAGVGQVTHEN